MSIMVVLIYNFIDLLILCYLLSAAYFACLVLSRYFCPLLYLSLCLQSCAIFKKFSMYGYFISTSLAFSFSHQKSIIKSNSFDPLYSIIRHKKVNEKLVVLSKFTLSAFYHTFSSCYWFPDITKQIPLSRFF